MYRVKINFSLEDVMLLSDFDDEGIQVVDLVMNSTSSFKSSSSFVFASFTQALPTNEPSPYKA